MQHLEVIKYFRKKNLDIMSYARRYGQLSSQRQSEFCENLADKAFVEDFTMFSPFAIHNVLCEYLDGDVCG